MLVYSYSVASLASSFINIFCPIHESLPFLPFICSFSPLKIGPGIQMQYIGLCVWSLHGAGCRPSANYCKFAVLVSVAKLRLKCVTLNLHPPPPRPAVMSRVIFMTCHECVTTAVITQTGGNNQTYDEWIFQMLTFTYNNLHLDLWLVNISWVSLVCM